MERGIRRTESGVEITVGALRWTQALLGLLTVLGAFGIMAYRKLDRVEQAVPRAEFRDTTRAIRLDLSEVRRQATEASANVLAMSCAREGYPSPWCDNVQRRVLQAGQARRQQP